MDASSVKQVGTTRVALNAARASALIPVFVLAAAFFIRSASTPAGVRLMVGAMFLLSLLGVVGGLLGLVTAIRGGKKLWGKSIFALLANGILLFIVSALLITASGRLKPSVGVDEMWARTTAGDYEGAVATADTYLAEYPGMREFLFGRAFAVGLMGRLDETERAATAIVDDPSTDPSWAATALALRSWTRTSQGRLDAALRDLQRAKELDPNQSLVYTSEADVLTIQGDLDGALLAVQKSRELNPYQGGLDDQEALVLELLGRPQEALVAWTASARGPDGTPAAVRVAILTGDPSALLAARPNDGWEQTLKKYGIGQLTDEGLLEAARQWQWEYWRASRMGQAHSLIGLWAEQGGELEKARHHFDLVLTEGHPAPSNQERWAKWKLAQLAPQSEQQ